VFNKSHWKKDKKELSSKMERRYSMSSSTFVVFVFLTLSLLVFGGKGLYINDVMHFDTPFDHSHSLLHLGFSKYCRCRLQAMASKRFLPRNRDVIYGQALKCLLFFILIFLNVTTLEELFSFFQEFASKYSLISESSFIDFTHISH
jgi:hypothetical protein